MEVRITFRAEVYIKGENIEEVRDKWEELPIFSADALEKHADFVELTSVEDAEDYTDLMSDFEY